MTNIKLFQDKKIRSVWNDDEEQWYFVLEDVVVALTDSRDPKQYIKRMKLRDAELAKGWVQIVPTLAVPTPGGPQRMRCANVKGLFRIIQSIPSPRAEPFKQWLAQVGYERLLEIENPELAQERMKELYEEKGYPKDWIDKRLRGMAIRQNLTDEWKKRGITAEQDYAILTAEISKATFGMTPSEYKEYKGLTKKNQPRRFHSRKVRRLLRKADRLLKEAETLRALLEKRRRKNWGEVFQIRTTICPVKVAWN